MYTKNPKKKSSSKKSLALTVALLSAAVILINLCVGLLPYSYTAIDLTKNKAYTVSETAKKYLSGITEETTLYVIDADGSNPKYEYFLRRIGDCNGKLHVKFVKADDVKELTDELGVTDYVTTYSIVAEGSKRSTFTDYASMFTYFTDNATLISYFQTDEIDALTYNYNVATLASSSDSSAQTVLEAMVYDMERGFMGDLYLCRMIEYVNIPAIPARYLLTGHGETDFANTELGRNMLAVCGNLGITYTELDTSEGADIPEDAVSILVFYPQNDISRAEADKLIAYLNGGGQMTFITGNENLSMPNLMSVIGAFGLSAEEGIVGEQIKVAIENTEETDGEEISSDGIKETEYETVYRTEVEVSVNTDHAAMAELKGMSVSPAVTEGNSILFNNELSADLKLTPILTTSEGSYVGENTEELAPRSVAAAAENEKSGARLLWFTGAKSFTHEIIEDTDGLDEGLMTTVYSNCYCVISSMGWAPFSYTSSVENMQSKAVGADLMSVSSSGFVLFTIVVIVAAVTAAVFGIIICYKRKKA